VEALDPGPPDYNTSALNHSATLPPHCILCPLHHRVFIAIFGHLAVLIPSQANLVFMGGWHNPRPPRMRGLGAPNSSQPPSPPAADAYFKTF